ncbi:conserved hypothetical protein [Vibrio jasicida]|uniref:Uncharacterized protein n=1 Tax=Vibrio jasicida TaxID=766224 RepID=A0AAU9QSI3_9VIBR|nr:conserved hypothetical protein [Vibrio jasicida]CAH1597296.1 conserved hypothetical protein [Vibrio jasicida]
MQTNKPITLQTYKNETTFYPEKDLFNDSLLDGVSEQSFESWLKCFPAFQRRFGTTEGKRNLSEMTLPCNKWYRYAEMFEAHCLAETIKSKYPEGFFECRNQNGEIAAFLPEPSDKANFRIALYSLNGPITHHTYNSREEALEELAKSGFKHEEGAVDSLPGILSFDRGVTIGLWADEGIWPSVGFERDKHLPHIKREFAENY